MNDFIYLECRIGKTVGLSTALIKKARKQFLKDGDDFKLVAGKIAYTKAAVKALVEGLLNCEKTSGGTKGKVKAVDIRSILSAALLLPTTGEKTGIAEVVEPVSPERRLPLPWTYWRIPEAELIVTRIFPRNSHVMHGKLVPEWIEKNGAAFQKKTGIDPRQLTHRIRVRSTLKFTIGMEVPCRWKQSDLWECTRPMPKRKGRWN